MAIYGVDQYGKAVYGADLGIDYTVTNLTAVQSDFSRITISWDAPRQNNWTSLTLVRSGWGFPVAITDGTALASWSTTGSHSSYSDVALPPGYWYYTVFAAVPLTTWSPTLTYQTGDRVFYSGSNWVCLVPYSLGVTPGTNSAVWSASYETQLWHPAGSIACLAVADHGYGTLLESLVPAPYKTLPGSSTDSGTENSDLTAFLGVLGFGFTQMQAELDDLLGCYDVLTTRQDRLAEISQMLGLTQELASSARFQRLRTLKAAVINQERGTAAGIIDAIHAATGLSASVVTGPNKMLTQDQSAFVSPQPGAWNPAEPYQLGDQVLYLGVRYTCTGFNYLVNSSNYVAASVTGSPNALTTTTISGSTVVKETSSTAPASITIPFTVLANGSYQALITAIIGPDYGIISATLDGVAVQIGHFPVARPGGGGGGSFGASLDMYATGAALEGNILTYPSALTPGAHTLVLQCAGKNPSATAYDLAIGSVIIDGSPVLYPPGNPPAGASTSAAQWSTTATSSDSTTYANPVTGGMGTWSALTANVTLNSVNYLGG